MKPLANDDMRPTDCDALRDWASSYGAAVRQRTVHQETTVARRGTLPEFMYQRQSEIAEKPIPIAFDARVSAAEGVTENETVEEAGDEYGESSDEEVDDSPDGFQAGTRRNLKLGNVSPRSKNSHRVSCAFQQSSALLTSSSDYVNL